MLPAHRDMAGLSFATGDMSFSQPSSRRLVQVAGGAALLLGLAAAASAFSQDAASSRLGLALAFGGIFGIVLQRSRFCFLCHTRDLVEQGDPRGVLSILVALAVGIAGYALIMSQWLPIPAPDRLPPTAHIGPVSPVLGAAAFVFGLGMAISGSCISAHLYRLGEGSPTAPFALVGTLMGFAIGFATWNGLYLGVVSEASVLWLPHSFGYGEAMLLGFAMLAALGVATLWAAKGSTGPEAPPLTLRNLLAAIFVKRWPASVGGAAVGVISAAYYLRIAPLGVTAELGSIARMMASHIGLAPETLVGLDGFRGCATAAKALLISENGLFVAGLVPASFASALIAGQFAPRRPGWSDARRGLLGGALMGWGAMTALGCTVGVLLSGIHAGAVSGWVFLAACFAGVLTGLWLRRLVARRL